jgi:hypothetical protein
VSQESVPVVGDFDDTRLMRMFLEMEGCHVLEAADSPEAAVLLLPHLPK